MVVGLKSVFDVFRHLYCFLHQTLGSFQSLWVDDWQAEDAAAMDLPLHLRCCFVP